MILAQFIILGIVSTAVGIVFGVLNSLFFKYAASWIKGHAIIEVFILFIFSIVSYFVSELIVITGVMMSGIITVLTCGIV